MATKQIKTYPNGEQYIEFSDEEMHAVGWSPGDTIKWTANGDGSYTLSRVVNEETEFVLVDCVSVFRTRYCVEVPKGETDWALDSVVLNEAKEFSQKHLDEIITGHRVISKEEAIELAVEDNGYGETWSEDKVIKAFITTREPEDDL